VFIKTVRARGYEYIQLVESYREGGQTKHRVLYNFGRRDQLANDAMFQKVALRLGEIAGQATVAKNDALPDCSDAVPVNYGYLAYAKLWRKLCIDRSLLGLQRRNKQRFNLSETSLLIAVQHLLAPRSKLAAFSHRGDYIGFSGIELQHLYRALDTLADNKEALEKALFLENFVKAGQQLDVVFYDVTTFAFESVVADALRDFGYSKDHKFNEVQVVMGLLIDARGMPVGYDLFPGNTYEGHTLVKMVEKLKKRFDIRRVIFVADRGLNSKANLKELSDAGFGYIVASRLKGAAKEVLQQVFDPEGYCPGSPRTSSWGGYSGDSEDGFRYKAFDYENVVVDENKRKHTLQESYVVTFSARRAAKDKADRQRLIDKALRLYENPGLVKSSFKRGGRKYLRQVAGEEPAYEVDAALIAKDERFDGYYSLQTSEKGMSVSELTEAYHMLWKIEESFKLMKSTLEVRPVFHWTKRRIEGHFVLCFLAFLLERAMEIMLAENGVEDASSQKVRDALNSMHLMQFLMDGQHVYLKERHKPLAGRIFSLLKLPIPKNISTYGEICKCLDDEGVIVHQLTLV
jgi:transposase